MRWYPNPSLARLGLGCSPGCARQREREREREREERERESDERQDLVFVPL